METVTSRDGTTLAYDRLGDGPPVVLVSGGSTDRMANAGLAAELAAHHSVYNFDRRGRGDSTDTPPYAVEREIEDIKALIEEAGGPAHVFGISSGAALALEAANRGLAIEKLALYEAPFIVDDSRAPVPDDYLQPLQVMVASDRRGDATRLFMRQGVGLPAVFVAMMQIMPAWSKLKTVAPTVIYDAAIVDDYQKGRPLPSDRWTSVTMPALVNVLPNARHITLEGQTHIVKPQALAPVLVEFFED